MDFTPESHRSTTVNGGVSKTHGGASASYFQKTVCLHDWWLIRAQNDFNGKTLAVAGLTSRPQQPVRVFSSAPIVKRYDVFTLETADGICVVIKGFINKLRTTDNGFTPEVFKHFVFGFPPTWETYAANFFQGEASESAVGKDYAMDNFPCKSEKADMNNCTLINTNSPLCENSPRFVEGRSYFGGQVTVAWRRGSGGSRTSSVLDTLQNAAEQGLDYGHTIAQEVMQSTIATESAVPFTDHLAGSSYKTSADIQGEEVGTKRKKKKESWKKAKRKILFDSPGSGTDNTKEKCIVSPECMSYGRSRSGRLLLPTMEFWRNQLPLYDSDRKLRGIQEVPSQPQPQPQPKPQSRGSKSRGRKPLKL